MQLLDRQIEQYQLFWERRQQQNLQEGRLAMELLKNPNKNRNQKQIHVRWYIEEWAKFI